jgi:phage-related protein
MEHSEKYRFNVKFLEDAVDFIELLDVKTREKVLENIRISRFKNDPRLLKKVDHNIWEFRTRYNSKQIRLLAFWDKESQSLVVCTHGFIIKTQTLPKKELNRAKRLRAQYFESKMNNDENLHS